jgi:hypothetical protein
MLEGEAQQLEEDAGFVDLCVFFPWPQYPSKAGVMMHLEWRKYHYLFPEDRVVEV